MSREVKRFMEEKGYSGWVDRFGIRKDYRRRPEWQFKTLEYVLDEYRVWKRKQDTPTPTTTGDKDEETMFNFRAGNKAW
jgi:hypothetical protein